MSNDRVADIVLPSWLPAERTKLSVLDEGDAVRFGLDVHVPGARMSLGSTIDHADLIAVRDMLTTIIDRNASQPVQVPPVASEDPKLAAWRAQED